VQIFLQRAGNPLPYSFFLHRGLVLKYKYTYNLPISKKTDEGANMAMSMSEIVKKSDEKRGMVAKTYKLPHELVQDIAQAAAASGKPQATIIAEAFALWQQQQRDQS
jgi:hypothetical protein